MSKLPKQETLFIQLANMERRIKILETLIKSTGYKLQVGGIIFTPQADSFFTDSDNSIEGLVATKDSDNKLYFYTGSTWQVLF